LSPPKKINSKADNLKYDVNKDGKFTEADNTKWSTTAGVNSLQSVDAIVVNLIGNNDGLLLTISNTSSGAPSSVIGLGELAILDPTYVTANSATQFVVADAGSNEDFTAYTGIKNAPTIAAGKNEGSTFTVLISPLTMALYSK